MDKRTLKLIQNAAAKGRMEGILFGFDIFAICLNHRYQFGVMRLASRVSELRKKGYVIEAKIEAVKNRFGETVYIKRYSLKEYQNGTEIEY